jgi:hypothetical protein
MSWLEDRVFLESQAQLHNRHIRLHTKDNLFSEVCAWILLIASFDQLKREKYLKKAATCFGNHHFYPKEWSTARVLRVLPHEGRHTDQLQFLGFYIHPLAGLPIAAIVYGFPFLPLPIAAGRFFMELDADTAAFRDLLWITENPALIRRIAQYRADSLASAMYLWAIPRRISRWLYRRMAQKVINEYDQTRLG